MSYDGGCRPGVIRCIVGRQSKQRGGEILVPAERTERVKGALRRTGENDEPQRRHGGHYRDKLLDKTVHCTPSFYNDISQKSSFVRLTYLYICVLQACKNEKNVLYFWHKQKRGEIKMYSYRTRGTCAGMINVELDGDTIRSVEFVGGCPGNTEGISRLVAGRRAQEVIDLFDGVTCGYKPTSCPDQLSKALREALAAEK